MRILLFAALLAGCHQAPSPEDVPTLKSVCAKHSKFVCEVEVPCNGGEVSIFVRWKYEDGNLIALLHLNPTQLDRVLTALEAK